MAATRFRTGPVHPSPESDVVVVHCSDPRYQPHFQEFLRTGLGLERYALVAVPGGPQFLTLAEYLPKFSWVGWRWIKFLVDQSRPRRVILIVHDDCLWYRDLRFWQHGGDWKGAALSDLAKVRDGLRARFGSLSVETYFARIDGGEVVFEAVGS